MTGEDTQATIRDFIVQQFPAARNRDIREDESLLELGIIDSMGVFEIVLFIEKQFGVTLTDDEMVADHFDSIPSMARLVRTKLGVE